MGFRYVVQTGLTLRYQTNWRTKYARLDLPQLPWMLCDGLNESGQKYYERKVGLNFRIVAAKNRGEFQAYCTSRLLRARINEINPPTEKTSPQPRDTVPTGGRRIVVAANPHSSKPLTSAPIEIRMCCFFVTLEAYFRSAKLR
jgi:hypothetical protein